MKSINRKIQESISHIRSKNHTIDKLLNKYWDMPHWNRLNNIQHKKNTQLKIMICAILIVTLFIAIIISTYYWFTTSKGLIPIGQDLKKSDWLVFWGSYLGFLGTTILGGISFWQNIRLHKVNKDLTEQNAISTFHSLLVPVSIEIKFDFIKPNQLDSLSQGTYQTVYEDPIPERIFCYLEHGVIIIRFANKTCFYPTKYVVHSIKAFNTSKSKKEIIFDTTLFPLSENVDYSFNFDFSNNTEFIVVHLPIHGGNRQRFKKMNTAKKLLIEVDFSYLNPFNILAHSILSTEFVDPNEDGSGIFFKQNNTNMMMFECSYKKPVN